MKFNPLYLLVVLSIACKPEDKENPYTAAPPITELEMVWSKQLAVDSSPVLPGPILLYNSDVLFPNSSIGDMSLTMLDGGTGNNIWTLYNDGQYYINISPNTHFINEESFVYNLGFQLSSIDISTGNVNWRYEVPLEKGLTGISNIGTHIYHVQKSYGLPDYESAYLVRSRINTPEWDTIFHLNRDSLNDYTPRITPPALWLKPNGDSVLVFQNQGYNNSTRQAQTDFYVFNLNKGNVEFYINELNKTEGEQILPALIDGNLAYFIGTRELYCIDLINQKLLWTKVLRELNEYLERSNLIISDDIIILNPDNEVIYGLNKFSGSEVWKNSQSGGLPGYMTLHEKVVYYTSENGGRLMGVSTINGDLVLAMQSPHQTNEPMSFANFRGYVEVNRDLNYIYAQDGYFLMCFKLPEFN